MRRRRWLWVVLLVLALLLTGCRNETQNRIRRNLQDFSNARMYITLYSLEGEALFTGIVDGKVTRSPASSAGSSDPAAGSYVFWYDERGRYHQSDLPYLVTNYDRQAEGADRQTR